MEKVVGTHQAEAGSTNLFSYISSFCLLQSDTDTDQQHLGDQYSASQFNDEIGSGTLFSFTLGLRVKANSSARKPREERA